MRLSRENLPFKTLYLVQIAMFKTIKFFLILIPGFYHHCITAQVQTKFGVTAGISWNKMRDAKDYTTFKIFDDREISQLRGYTSPVLGLNAGFKYKMLYSSVGVEFNTISTSYYYFRESGFKKTDANQNIQMIRYYADNASSTSYSKLNIPVEAGIQIFKKYVISPFIFSGINLSYILSGKISRYESDQDMNTRIVTTTSSTINVLDKNDNYEFWGSRLKKQFIIGAGLQLKKHLVLKGSLRSNGYFNVSEKTVPNDLVWDCFAGYWNALENKEYVLVLNYTF